MVTCCAAPCGAQLALYWPGIVGSGVSGRAGSPVPLNVTPTEALPIGLPQSSVTRSWIGIGHATNRAKFDGMPTPVTVRFAGLHVPLTWGFGARVNGRPPPTFGIRYVTFTLRTDAGEN